jgi:hypothetical protein
VRGLAEAKAATFYAQGGMPKRPCCSRFRQSQLSTLSTASYFFDASSCGESFCVLLDCDGHQIVYKHAITTTSPAHAVALQDKSGPVENIPAAKRPLIRRTPKPAARRAVTPDARARFCSRWLDLQCQTTRGSIRVLRIAPNGAGVPNLQQSEIIQPADRNGRCLPLVSWGVGYAVRIGISP